MKIKILLIFSVCLLISVSVNAIEIGAVPSEQVCMVNDNFIGKPQIPVTVDDKTYYGCCPGCVERIKNNILIRTATDPVSMKKVDKGTAVIASINGKAVYFENKENLNIFQQRIKKIGDTLLEESIGGDKR